MRIYELLELDKLDTCVAIIKNAKSEKYGKKDIIKIEGVMNIDLDALASSTTTPPCAPLWAESLPARKSRPCPSAW